MPKHDANFADRRESAEAEGVIGAGCRHDDTAATRRCIPVGVVICDGSVLGIDAADVIEDLGADLVGFLRCGVFCEDACAAKAGHRSLCKAREVAYESPVAGHIIVGGRAIGIPAGEVVGIGAADIGIGTHGAAEGDETVVRGDFC